MSRKLWLVGFVAFVLTLGGVPAAADGPLVASSSPTVAAAEDGGSPPVVDAKVRRQLEVTETARFVVVFSERADLRAAGDIADFATRGQFVVDELRSAAERSQRRAREVVADRGGRAESFWFRNAMIVEGDEALLDALAALPGVAEIRPERVYPLVRPVAEHDPVRVAAGDPEWGIAKIGADRVWDDGILGGGVVVANVDTGVDYTHEALVNQYRGNLGNGEFSHDYNWWDPTGICGDAPCDNVEHGTHTMGTMVGGDGPGPFTPDIGVAPGAQWIAAKGCEDFGCSEFALLSSGQWILAPTDLNGENPDPAKRPDIVNNSWGGGPGDPFYLETVENWRAAGIIPVFSSGNPGSFCGDGGSPGDYNETFSAGATDIDDVIADFSGRGPSFYGKINPNVTAPGVNVTSSVPGDGYAAFDGTSMAAPHVSGTLALVLSSTPELYGDFDGATSAVASTAVDIIDTTCGGDDDGDPNNVYGDGRIDAYTAVQLVATGGTLTGTITDVATGEPIAGARVVATLEEREFSATAGDDGAYEMFLPANVYVVMAEAFGYETGVVSGVVIETDLTTTQDLALTALPRYTVSGRVLRAENRTPIVGAEVAALGTPVAPAITDATGAYSLTLPLGVYTLEASHGGCLSVDQREVQVFSNVRRNFGLVLLIDDFGHGCELIPFEWVDAAQPTTVYGDDQTGRLPLPFPFPFFGVDYQQLFIASNGYLAFADEFIGWSTSYDIPIPNPDLPNAAIYALWQDLWVVDAAHVDYEALESNGQQVLVVEYAGVPRLAETEGADFEVKLWEDGTIDLLYGATIDAVGGGDGATIGIEDGEGRDGLMYSHDASVLEPETALRYHVVPTGIVSGAVTNLNDGLPVAGATVTASPGGRSATTDEDGIYSLRLVPGRYTLTYEAEGYEAAARIVRLAADEVLTIDVALAAPQAVVTPEALEVATEVGEPVSATVTVANGGSAPLTWEVFERETGVTPPDLPPASEPAIRPATGERFDAPDGFQPDLRAWPTYEGPLEEIITDPAGDGGVVDVTAVRAGADELEVSFELDYSADTLMDRSVGFVFLDTDQDPASGLPPEAFFGLPTQDIGMEYFVDLWPAAEGLAYVVDAVTFNLVAEIAVETIGQSYRFDIPLGALGDDGAMDVAVALSDWDFFTFDWAPDVGHGSVAPFRDAPWMSEDPAEGTVEPGASADVAVTLGGAGFDPGDYAGELVFSTNDPRQGITEVGVELAIELPADFGALGGTITNARAGFPLPAIVTVAAERDGAPYPVEKQALDTDGTYVLYAPEGTWPTTVAFGGYVTWEGEATIAAGVTTALDVALDPLWPFATLEGGPIEVELAPGETATAELTLGNVEGLAPLTFEVFEREGEPVAVATPAPTATPAPAAGAGSSSAAPAGYEAVAPGAHTEQEAEVAVFLDLLPWESDALFFVLDANGIAYDLYGSADMANVDLAAYRVVIISNDQPQTFYTAFTSNLQRFDDFAAAGGYLWFGAAAWGWNGGDLTNHPLPGGVVVGAARYEDCNVVTQVDHPTMAGVGNPFCGSFASHTWLQNVPDGATIALGEEWGDPTLIEYAHGAGRVLVTSQPLEYNWGVGEPGGTILQNAVVYVDAFQPYVDLPWLSEDPASGSVAAGDATGIAVTIDATGLEPGVYAAAVAVVTDDPLNPVLTTTVTLTVTG